MPLKTLAQNQHTVILSDSLGQGTAYGEVQGLHFTHSDHVREGEEGRAQERTGEIPIQNRQNDYFKRVKAVLKKVTVEKKPFTRRTKRRDSPALQTKDGQMSRLH